MYIQYRHPLGVVNFVGIYDPCAQEGVVVVATTTVFNDRSGEEGETLADTKRPFYVLCILCIYVHAGRQGS